MGSQTQDYLAHHAIVHNLRDFWSRLCIRGGYATDEEDCDGNYMEIHLWAEGPLPGGLTRRLRCGEDPLH